MTKKRLQLTTGTLWPKKVAIMGVARSGIAAAQFFLDKGIPVFLSDRCSQDQLAKVINKKGLEHVTWEADGHTERIFENELIILSPGIESDLPILDEARNRGVTVWSEMELGFQASSAPFFAVTGSTGKSTTVSMAGAALEAAGIEHAVAGNIGIPVISSAPKISENGVVIAEVSSFQLETIEQFSPSAAVILNLMKNHLDRYRHEEDYYNAKKNIALNMDENHELILNANDGMLRSWGDEIEKQKKVVYFGEDVPGNNSIWFEGDELYCRDKNTVERIGDFTNMILPGKHNRENAAVAAYLAKLAGASYDALVNGICAFKGLPHRLEYVAAADGVAYYNDSKSTTAESITCAVEAFPRGVHLIAGGRDKGCDFSVVSGSLKKNAKSVTLIGEAANRMKKEWETVSAPEIAGSLKEAVDRVQKCAKSGEAVVFSPGCSSFDMFRNYEDRGEQFKLLVRQFAGSGVASNE